MSRKKPVTVGVYTTYASQQEAALALGMSAALLTRRIKNGISLENPLLQKPQPIEINGREYPSLRAAHRAHGINRGTFAKRKKKGQPLTAPLNLNWRAVTINGVTYPSIAEAARCLNADVSLVRTRLDKNIPFPWRAAPECCERCGRNTQERRERFPRVSPKLVPDHDHKTGAFRGWLCNPCNLGLGLLGDMLADILQMVAYLKRHYDHYIDAGELEWLST